MISPPGCLTPTGPQIHRSPGQHAYVECKHDLLTSSARFVLSYKELPFETVWVEYPDIATVLKDLGVSPKKRSVGDIYTVPVLNDPNTGALIDESLEIAAYLDKTYPAKPIFPHGSEMLIRVFHSAYLDEAHPIVRLVLVRTAEILNSASAEFFRRTRSERLQLSWEEFSPEGPKRDGDWAYLEQGFNKGEELYAKCGGRWVMGDTFSYADITVACRLLWFKRVLKEDEWARVSSWNGGRWAKMLDDVQQECHLA
jgi:glutathione S-transferase